jgi:hypothetical protein
LGAFLAAGLLCAGGLLAQTPIPSTYVLPVSAADTNSPGFIWNVSQVAAGEPNQISWAEGQLAGLEGPNMADPNSLGTNGVDPTKIITTGPAQPANPATAPISFSITNVINLSRVAATTIGNFTPDDQMPGIPGTAGNGTDNTAAEILTYLALPAGVLTMGVNSDDGFKVTIGGATPQDKLAVNVGQFDGGRGANDSIFQIQVPQPGLYAARCLYYNGTGDANIEWFTVLDGLNGTNKVLINDLVNGGIPAYRVVNASARAYFTSVDPLPAGLDVYPSEGVHLSLADGSTPIATSSVSLALDGSPVVATVNRNGSTTTIDYNLSSPWGSLSTHSATVAFTDGTTPVTNSWSWTVQHYISLDAGWRVAAVDTTKPGFNWNIFANSDPNNTINQNERAERDLSLQAIDAAGLTLANFADPTAAYGATGPATAANPISAPIHFEVASTINFDIATPNMPGAPSTDATTDGQAAEVVTYLSLPAGAIGMEVDADDGWRLYAGAQPGDAFGRAVVAENNGRATAVKFSFVAPQAGIYPFRLVWENGGGGSHLKWYSLNSSGNPVLINDLANSGIPAYRALPAGTVSEPVVAGVSPLVGYHSQKLANTNLYLALLDGTHTLNDSSISLTIDGKPVTGAHLTTQRQGSYLTVTDGGTAFQGLWLLQDAHLAVLSYKDSAGTYSRTQQWFFNNIQVLTNVPANPILSENFDSYPEATSVANTVPPGWTAWNFTVPNTPAGWDLTQKGSDSYKNWIIISTNTLLGPVESGAGNNDPNQTINGQPVAEWIAGNVLWATSDGRSGPQVQFCMSKPFDLSSITNPVMLFSSMIRMSAEANEQANGIEYSIDGGNTWYPGIIYVSIAHSRPDYISLLPSGDIDVIRTLNPPFIAAQNLFGTWTDPGPGPFTGQVRGNTLAAGLGEPATQALAPFLAIRDDDPPTSQRVDGMRLPKASLQKNVILRFYQLGNCSWWWGVDNLAFYDMAPPFVPPSSSAPHIDSITASGGQITIKWSNGGTLFSSPTVVNTVWTTTGNSSGTFTAPIGTGNLFFRVQQ